MSDNTGKKVFVGNLAYETTEEELKTFFEEAGSVVESTIVRRGNRSKGFGFVEFSTEEEAQKAVELLDKKDLNDRPINVQVSTSSGMKVGNSNNDNRSGGGYYRDNYRDNYRNDYRDNYRNNDYRDNYRNNDYRDNYRNNDRNDYQNDYGDDYSDNRGPRRTGGRGRSNYNNNDGGRRVYYLRNNDSWDNYNSRGGGGNRNNNRPRRNNNNNNNNRYRNNVEKVESHTTIFVANLPFDVDDEQLIELFGKCGAIKTAHVVKNRGRSKGYGFVEFEDNDGQKKAISEMDNFQILYKNGEERNLSVKVAMATGDEVNEVNEGEEGDDENDENEKGKKKQNDDE